MEGEKVYKFNFSNKVIYLGILHIVVAAIAAYLLYILYEGEYISVWFGALALALFCLQILSIPRLIVTSPTQIKIICVLELTEINIDDIVRVRKVNPRSLKYVIPLFGGYGFFGYYGVFFDLQRAEKIKIYASEWRYLVEIVDIYEDRYYVSCRNRDSFIKEIQQRRNEIDRGN
ncbi:MAG: PH domain-containing protein [Rikenellaceae bacterium]